MGLLTIEQATKRLQAAHATQEGIENMSTWMLHHTDSVRMLADCWLNLFRTEAEERRVVLFYIMNDVVQRAKKKHVDVFCSTFEQPAISAVSLARFSEKLRGVMSRCLKLIAECKAFSASGIDRMNRMIVDPNGDTDDGNYEIDVIDLAKKIEAFMQSVNSISKGYEIMKRSPVDFEEQIQTRMKDRKEGALLLKETRTSILRLEKFGEAVANNNKRLYEFVDGIETAKRLFNMQLRDVAVVEDAYVKFGQGVREVQEEVEEMVRSGVYPAGSPPRDAPSPSAEDDVFSAGVEQVLNKMRPHDVTDEADMDVDDDEPPLPPQKWEKKPTLPSTTPSTTRPSLMEKAAALAANMPFLASHMGIDPRARPNTTASAAPKPVVSTAQVPTITPSSSTSIAPPPAKKPSIDSDDLHAVFMRAAATIPSLAHHAASSSFPTTAPSTSSTTTTTATHSIPYPQPPPLFAPNIPPPPPSVVAQFMAMQQQQQQQQQSSVPLAVHTLPPSLPSAPPPISPYSAPPPGYPPVSTTSTSQQQYMVMQQQQQLNRPQTAYPPSASRGYTPYGGSGTAPGGYQQPVNTATASASQQQYAPPTQGYEQQQGQKKYSTMPEFSRSNSTPGGGPLTSPTGSASSGYYPVNNTPSTPAASTSAAGVAAGTPYTPTAPGYRGRKGSEGGGGGGYNRGGGQQYSSGYGGGYGGGYGSQQEDQSEDAYQPQQRKDSHDTHDSDFRQQQQYQPRGGGGTARGYGRGNQGGGYGRFQRGGGTPRGRGGFGGQHNYGSGGYSNQGY